MKVSIKRDKAIVRFKNDGERIQFIKLLSNMDVKITDRVGDVHTWLEVFQNEKKGDEENKEES